MATKLIQLPIDFGHTHDGRYQPSGLRVAASVLGEAFRQQLTGAVSSLDLPVQYPTHDEPRPCPLKYDALLTQVLDQAWQQVRPHLEQRPDCFPVVLGGDHTVSCLTAAIASYGMQGSEKLGAIVFDAHTDFNAPGPVAPIVDLIAPGHTISGNAHGMIHALLGGLTEPQFSLAAWCKKFSRLDPTRLAILGVRTKRYHDLEQRLQRINPLLIPAADLRQATPLQLQELAAKAFMHATNQGKEPYYLSFDFDALDPEFFPWVQTPVAEGLTLTVIQEIFNTWIGNDRRLLRALDCAELMVPDGQQSWRSTVNEVVEQLIRVVAQRQSKESSTGCGK